MSKEGKQPFLEPSFQCLIYKDVFLLCGFYSANLKSNWIAIFKSIRILREESRIILCGIPEIHIVYTYSVGTALFCCHYPHPPPLPGLHAVLPGNHSTVGLQPHCYHHFQYLDAGSDRETRIAFSPVGGYEMIT